MAATRGAVFGDIDRAVSAMAHRGPDASGTYIDDPFAIGHTRLSIIDLSKTGAQPMHSSDGRYVISFNGEIYNFRELGNELKQRGVRLRGTSDTEVVLELYRMEGPDVLARLNGMFALAIIDRIERTLLVARDPVGVKPLYTTEGEFGFGFASEIKALLEIAPVDRTVDPIALRQYLTYLWSPGERTPFKAVRKLEPGRALLVSKGRVARSWIFSRMPRYAPRRDWDRASCAEALRDEVDLAVNRQLVADAPLGAFLSGGVDSTAIVAAAIRKIPGLRCYTMAVVGAQSKELSEDLPFARMAAEALKVPLTEVPVSSDDLAMGIERMVSELDEPLADPACLNVRQIASGARADGIKVLLSGTGGDDVFSGYRRHQALAYDVVWSHTPKRLRSALSHTAGSPMMRKLAGRRVVKLLGGLAGDADQRLARSFAWIDPAIAEGLLAPDLRAEAAKEVAGLPIFEHLATVSAMPVLEKCLELDRRFFLADHNLLYSDKMGMAAGVEIRVPLLDLELLAFASSIPSNWKMQGLAPKAIFKQSQIGRVPDAILKRSKTGFGVPLRSWLRGPLAPMCDDLTSRSTLLRRGYFDPARVEQLRRDDADGRLDAAYTIFSLMLIELWARRFIDTHSV